MSTKKLSFGGQWRLKDERDEIRPWRCCGKPRGRAKFCPDCGSKRPEMSDAELFLAWLQWQRDDAEARAESAIDRATELSANMDRAPTDNPMTREQSRDWEVPMSEWRSVYDSIASAVQSAESTAATYKRKAKVYGEWADIVSGLMVKANESGRS